MRPMKQRSSNEDKYEKLLHLIWQKCLVADNFAHKYCFTVLIFRNAFSV